MENVYKLSLNNSEYWAEELDDKTNERILRRINEPTQLFVQRVQPYVVDNMLCNYQAANEESYPMTYGPLGVRLRSTKDFIVIEPTGIKVPKENFTLVKEQSEMGKTIKVSTLTCTSYFCNLMSDSTRSGKDEIPYEEVEHFKQELLSQPSEMGDQVSLTPFEFTYMFVNECHKKDIKAFDSNELLSFIIKTASDPKYFPLLGNIEYEIGEHYDMSEDLFKALALLRYMGLTHPDYEAEHEYGTVNIDDVIDVYPQLVCGKEEQAPLMEQFVNECFGLSNEKSSNKGKRKNLNDTLKANGN